jgi:hypothetical protein
MMKTVNLRRLVAVRLLDARTRLSIPGSDLSRSGFFYDSSDTGEGYWLPGAAGMNGLMKGGLALTG